MTYKISKFLTIGLLVFSVQSMDSLNASNVSEENNNQINLYNNTINMNNYSSYIPTYYEMEVSATEIKEFFENMRNNPSALINAKFQLYCFKDYILPDVLNLLDEYFDKLVHSNNTLLDDFYQKKISNSPNDLSIQFVALINQYLNNVISQVNKKYKEIPSRAYLERDVWECYCNIITKIIRGVNLASFLLKEKQEIILYERNNLSKVKNKPIANVFTLSNNNCKCWFMSTFQLFVTALNQSEPNDPIRKTNFAKFINHLRNMQNDFSRSVKTQQNKIDPYKKKVYNEWNYFKQSKEWEYRNVMRDRTGKSNVIGERIDLISELILWCSKNNSWYKVVENKNNINDITEKEEERRNEAIELLQSIQDINSGSYPINAVIIMLNLFPELNDMFGSFYNPKLLPTAHDDIIHTIKDNDFVMNNNEMKKECNITYKYNNKIPKLSSFTPDGHYLTVVNVMTKLIMSLYEYKNVFNSNQYVFMTGSYSKNMFITKYNSNNQLEIYELIGIVLSNQDHAVCFVKTGKSDSSWSGIDSNREANDNGYILEDIMYNEILGNSNTYLGKVYSDQNKPEQKRNPYIPEIAIYKKLPQDEIKNINKQFIKVKYKQLLKFEQWSYDILRKEYADYIVNQKNDNNILYACKQILSAISSQENNKEMYHLLNNKGYNHEVENIIYKNICRIKQTIGNTVTYKNTTNKK